jgi:folate-binding protein YgfZ
MSWQKLIEQQSQSTSMTDGNSIIPLSGWRLIQVAGEEAKSFLQNLLTNDVNALQLNQSQLSGFCNPKGRLLAIFQLVRRQDDYLIVLPAELAETISQRLTMFKLRSKVEISLLENSHVLGLVHPGSEPGSTEVWQGQRIEEGLIIRQPGETSRSLLIADDKNIEALTHWLQQDWQIAPASLWQRLDIEAGLPMVFAESKEAFTPQQINLDLAGGVSFKKGCYPGQEVVARLHYLGSPSRRLFLGQLHANTLPGINSAVTDAGGETLGHVVQSQFSDEETIVCQLSMKLSAVGKTAMLGDQQIESLTPLATASDSA